MQSRKLKCLVWLSTAGLFASAAHAADVITTVRVPDSHFGGYYDLTFTVSLKSEQVRLDADAYVGQWGSSITVTGQGRGSTTLTDGPMSMTADAFQYVEFSGTSYWDVCQCEINVSFSVDADGNVTDAAVVLGEVWHCRRHWPKGKVEQQSSGEDSGAFAGAWSGTFHQDPDNDGTLEWTVSDNGRISGTGTNESGDSARIIGHVGDDGMLVGVFGAADPFLGTAWIDDDGRMLASVVTLRSGLTVEIELQRQ